MRRLLRLSLPPAWRFDWRYAIGEFLLIVAGVLVALAANSWWESRERVDRERSYLEYLLADTRENAERIGAAIAEDSLALARARMYMRTLNASRPLPPEDSLPRSVRTHDAFANPDFRPLLGTYTALLEAGDLQLLRSETLRFRLVSYLSSLESAREMVRQSSAEIREQEDVFMRELLIRAPGALGEGGTAASSFLALRGNPNSVLALGSALFSREQRIRTLTSLREEGRVLVVALEGERGADALPERESLLETLHE